ncbi:GntR family transcriptional regulator [Leucobacter sp. UT-8R-CII-1-4]|uniref:GntR family transcriptional regulator n=1 Tax=Leucobacter sp. UT-8R-CII-1-4 TaxID=3040075 RepID=UPI0024A953F5|nr:GntR family transcriptional regulator [Leucobacter sp. UT-8R-CII-1-4]MDI6023677.1 GntR family transcriptional regulator [Leucobacter sp. UT-8R-CII-1-4]
MNKEKESRVLRDRLTISQELTDILRGRVIRGEFPPGTRIAEESIAREFGISRGPVREALRQLEKDGLIVVEAYKGAIVVEISDADLRGILLPVRYVLEKFALEGALKVLQERDLEALQNIIDLMTQTVNEGGPDQLQNLVDLDVEFHTYIINMSNDYHAEQLWSTIEPRIRAGFYQLGSLHEHPGVIVDEHVQLLEVIRGGDLTAALEMLDEHVLASPIRLLGRRQGNEAHGE